MRQINQPAADSERVLVVKSYQVSLFPYALPVPMSIMQVSDPLGIDG